jgi:hypothetical protein
MLISVINDSDGHVADEELLRAIRAINRQIDHDFRPYWHLSGELRLAICSALTPATRSLNVAGEAVIRIEGVRTKPNDVAWYTAGYHEKDANGLPVGHVYADATLPGISWQLVLSHECLELIANPMINLFVPGPHPDGRSKLPVFHCYEVCDAVMLEPYELDGIPVSNFLLPLYFVENGHETGRVVYHQRRDVKPLRSFGLNPDRYIPYYDPRDHARHEWSVTRDENGELVGIDRVAGRLACNLSTPHETPPWDDGSHRTVSSAPRSAERGRAGKARGMPGRRQQPRR